MRREYHLNLPSSGSNIYLKIKSEECTSKEKTKIFFLIHIGHTFLRSGIWWFFVVCNILYNKIDV